MPFETKETLCWQCKKSGGLCSWSKTLTPVDGWEAEKTSRKTYADPNTDSYHVINCPEFVEG